MDQRSSLKSANISHFIQIKSLKAAEYRCAELVHPIFSSFRIYKVINYSLSSLGKEGEGEGYGWENSNYTKVLYKYFNGNLFKNNVLLNYCNMNCTVLYLCKFELLQPSQ